MVIFLFLHFWVSEIFSDEIIVEVDPPTPTANSEVKVFFNIVTENKLIPFLQFDALGAEVLGKNNLGVSMRDMIIDGKVVQKRQFRFQYNLYVEQAGTLLLKDIIAKFPLNKIGHPDVTIEILQELPPPADIFLQAEVSKDIVYLGEGIDVRYYLYYQSQVIQKEFLSYPQFDSCIKRFLHPRGEIESVKVGGVKYSRSLEYQVRLYPEEVGKVAIDALTSRVHYLKSGENAFGQFGSKFQHQVSEDLRSVVKEITVLPLPAELRPASFMGLVGQHQFSIILGKQHLAMNTPFDITLLITGPGALEKLDPPPIFSEADLEQFNAKGEILDGDLPQASRKFVYTYLALKALNIDERKMEFSFFDPELREYKKVEVLVPAIKIGTNALASSGEEGLGNLNLRNDLPLVAQKLNGEGKGGSEKVGETMQVIAPVFTVFPYSMGLVDFIITFLAIILVLILFLIASPYLFSQFANDRDRWIRERLQNLLRHEVSYQDLFELLSPFGVGTTLKELISSLAFDPEVTKYLLDLVEQLKMKNYRLDGLSENHETGIRIEKKFLTSIRKTLKNCANNREYQAFKNTVQSSNGSI